MNLKSKVKKNYFDETVYLRQFDITRKFELQGNFVDKGSGYGIFPDPGDSGSDWILIRNTKV